MDKIYKKVRGKVFLNANKIIIKNTNDQAWTDVYLNSENIFVSIEDNHYFPVKDRINETS